MPQARDEADIASEQEERFRQEALFKAGRYSRLAFTGSCHWCGEACQGAFCDVGCRTDFEKDEKVRLRTRAQGQDKKDRPR